MATIKGTSMIYTLRDLYNELDDSFRNYLDNSEDSRCLLDLLKFPAADIMPSLVSYFLEFYNPEENVFRINDQVLCISLEDVLFLTGLPIDGEPVIDHGNRDAHGFHRVFGLRNQKFHSTAEMKKVVIEGKDNEVRKIAVLLLIVRCFIVPSDNGGRVSTTYLRFIENVNRVDTYAWGAALLAFLYHGIAEWKRPESKKKTVEGNSWIILGFFLLRIPKLREELSNYLKLPITLNVSELTVPFLPPIIDQVGKMTHNHRADFVGFRNQLDNIFLNLAHEVPQQPNKHDCGLFVIHMMELFLQKDPTRFTNDNLKMFGKNWFDPLTACALRERIKPIIEAEIKIESKRDELKAGNTLGKKRRRVIGEKKIVPIEPLEHVQKKVTRAKARKIVTRDQTRRHMKLRRNIKTMDGPVMKRKQIKYSEGSADLTLVNQNVRNLRSTIKTVLGHKRKREHVDYAHLSNKPRKGYKLF
ncbi:hypothetical protein ACET3Z_031648 [Daucus carota]